MTDRQLAHNEVEHASLSLPVSLWLHDVTDPLNVGSLFRLADALGVECLYLSGDTPAPPDRKIRKTSRSTEACVLYEVHASVDAVLNRLRHQQRRLLALEITDRSVPVASYPWGESGPVCLLLGHEQDGVSAELLSHCEAAVHLPMRGRNSSMNVAMAAAIAVHHAAYCWQSRTKP